MGMRRGVIKRAGGGVDPTAVTLTFTPAIGSASTDTMAHQATSATIWPPAGANAAGQNVKIAAKYPFRTFLAVFWAGSGQALNDSAVFYLPASSTEPIQY